MEPRFDVHQQTWMSTKPRSRNRTCTVHPLLLLYRTGTCRSTIKPTSTSTPASASAEYQARSNEETGRNGRWREEVQLETRHGTLFFFFSFFPFHNFFFFVSSTFITVSPDCFRHSPPFILLFSFVFFLISPTPTPSCQVDSTPTSTATPTPTPTPTLLIHFSSHPILIHPTSRVS